MSCLLLVGEELMCLDPLNQMLVETFPRAVTGKLQPLGAPSKPGGWDLAGLRP